MNKVVIIGGGFTGKLASLVASKIFKEVIVFEKNKCTHLKESINIIQQEHTHILLKQGLIELEKICPKITQRLINKGAINYDIKKDFHWYHYGGKKYRYSGDFFTIQQSRKLLEDTIQEYVNETPNIIYYDNSKFIEFIYDTDSLNCKGVRILKSKEDIQFFADAFVYATGQSNITKRKMFPNISTVKCEVNLTYYSRNYKIEKEFKPSWKGFACSPMFPNSLVGGVIIKIEKNDEYTVTLSEYSKIGVRKNKESIADSLPSQEIKNFINKGVPTSDWKTYSIPYTEFLEINKFKQKPRNLFVIGNAYCLLDPIFGQGLSVGAMQANVFCEALNKYDKLEDISKYYYSQAEKIIWKALNISYVENIQMKPFTKIGIFNKIKHILNVYVSEMSTYDKDALDTLVSVMHLQKTFTDVLNINIIKKVFKHILIRRQINTKK